MSQASEKIFNTLVGVIERHIAPHFKPGTRITVIARTPGNNEADVLVTSDQIPELQALLERSLTREVAHDTHNNDKKKDPAQ